tara:strand:+ start:913 stop:1158 length:246 start_codon:yes stop_codon:yes gene_type:complete
MLKKILAIAFMIVNCGEKNELFTLDDNSYMVWKNFIKPTKSEQAWAQIQWRSTFYDGLIESDREQKPLLLWVMNGHPLGCT